MIQSPFLKSITEFMMLRNYIRRTINSYIYLDRIFHSFQWLATFLRFR